MAGRGKKRGSAAAAIGHNGGPPLDEPHRPEWGPGPIATYFHWKAAYAAAWKSVPREVALRRLDKAEMLGLTYEEYTLELLERGRYLQSEDVERIAEIKRSRRKKRRSVAD